MIAPGRARRPGAEPRELEPPTAQELDGCPFCEGREDRTPPEMFALAPPGRPPDTPGWQVRVVPNKFPAFARQEVVVHVPRHARSLVELAPEELDRVAEAWRARAEAARAEGFPYVQVLVNEGREAGASLPHSHSQLVWLEEEPPAVQEEWRPGCGVCEEVRSDERRILERDSVVLVSRFAPRVPYELLVAPIVHEITAFASERLSVALAVAVEGLRRIHRLEGAAPMNLWLHGGPHWHLELVPRLTVLAGLELGAGIFVNPLPPEQAAARLREAG